MDDNAHGATEESSRSPGQLETLAGDAELELDGSVLSRAGRPLPAPAARFFALSLDLLVTAGADGYIKDVNPAWETLLGWTPAELRARPYIEFVHPDDRERTINEAAGLMAAGPDTVDFEVRFLAKDGLFRWLLFSAQADADSGLLYATAKDITDRTRAEHALREAEERFRSAFENAAIGMSMTSTDGRFLRVNRALSEITGYSEDELVDTPIREMTHPDDVEADLAAMARLRSGESNTFRTEKRYLRHDGTPVWVSLSSSVVRDADGTALYFISQMEGIDARKHAEEDLQAALRQFHSLTQSVTDAIVSADERGRIVFWSESAREIFGYGSDEVMGEPLTKLMPERYRDAHTAGIARLGDGGKSRLIGGTVILEGLRKDGTEFPLELSLGEWQGADQRQYTGVVRDITERRRTERYAAAQHAVAQVLAENPTLDEAGPQLLAGIGENMQWQVGGLWLVDGEADALRCAAFWQADGVQVPAFEKASRTIRLSRRVGLPGRVWQSGESLWIPDAAREPNFPRAHAALEDGLHSGIGLPILSGRDVLGVIDFFSAEIKRPDEALLRMMATIGAQLGQFFERKRTEAALAATTDELRRRAAELERSNADLEQFAYVASHDLSEPLRMVSGFVQLLADRYRGQLDANADDFIDFTLEGVARMQKLIDDLLAFSRVGRSVGENTRVDCDRVVRRSLDPLATEIERSGARVEVEDLPAVRGREAEIGQVFQNLLSNALKFHGDEPPQVHVRAEPDGQMWMFSVVDNGIGIESRHAERIFKMFQRLHAREDYPGTGIGLPICKKVVERHGGRIWVEPAPEGGSAFKFTLPGVDGGDG